MTREEILKAINMMYDVGASPEHYASVDFCAKRNDLNLYIMANDSEGLTNGVEDSITIDKLDSEAVAWIERWTAALRKERVQV